MSAPDVTTKADLLADMRAGWEALNAYLDTLSEAQATQVTDEGGWSIKDHIIHIALWEGSMNAVLQRLPRWEYMGVDRETWEQSGINQINDVMFRRNRDLSWPQAREHFRQMHDELIGRIETMPEANLQRPYNYFQPESTQTQPIGMRLGVASYRHYATHMPWIEALVESATQQGISMSESPTINKAELLEKMQRGWETLNIFIATLTPEQMTTPSDAAGWTVKDHLMHLAVWQDGVYALLEGRDRVAAMGVPQAVWDSRDFDQINAVIQQNHRDVPLDEVLRTLQDVYKRFYVKVQSLSVVELSRPNPASPAGTPMIEYVSGDSYDHYAAHIPWMETIARGGR